MTPRSIYSGCATRSDNATKEFAFFAFEPRERPGSSTFGMLDGSKWSAPRQEPHWPAIAMACAKYAPANWIAVAISQAGEVWELAPETAVERMTTLPGNYIGLTKLANIENAVWACGMGRTVLKRESNGGWIDLSAPTASVDEGVIGFTALSGVTPGEMVAVGWQGEIWLRRNNVWDPQQSGTNANFNAVSVGPDGEIVAVGDGGSMVVGVRNQWTSLDLGVDFDLQGVSHFGAQLFICSDDKIFLLENSKLVDETRFAGGDRPASCLNLIRGSLSLYSQGENDIFRFSSGVWSRVL